MQMDAVRAYGCKRKQIALQLIKQNQSNIITQLSEKWSSKHTKVMRIDIQKNANKMGHLKPRVHLLSKHAEIVFFCFYHMENI